MNIKCPHCQSPREEISIDISLIVPFKVDNDGNLFTNYEKEDMICQSREAVSDDMFAFCYHCGGKSKIILDEESGKIIGLEVE